MSRQPDFSNLLAVLNREKPSRPTLFEFFLNWDLYAALAGQSVADKPNNQGDILYEQRVEMLGFFAAGYDYASIGPRGPNSFFFHQGERHSEQTISLNEGGMITDRASFDAYQWPDPDSCDYSVFEKLAPEIPSGGKIVAHSPGGVLENAIGLVGFETLCIMTMAEPDLAQDLFDAVGSRLVRFYEISSAFPSVGACVSNDDWGFKNQTMLSPDQMRQYVFPWHKRIVKAIHDAGKPAILHSCGNLESVFDDIIGDMEFDGKHSYEDTIMPVEEAYDRWGSRIAILGGIDVDFLIRSSADDISARSQAMIERSGGCKSYALGSGNSIPAYIPQEKYFAMTGAVTRPQLQPAG